MKGKIFLFPLGLGKCGTLDWWLKTVGGGKYLMSRQVSTKIVKGDCN